MKEVFIKLSNAKSLCDLDVIIAQYDFSEDIEQFKKKYPEVDLTLSADDINDLVNENIITEDHRINLSTNRKFSPFEKLLLSVLWKNGHLLRVQPIIDSIRNNRRSTSDYGVIFRQFGRSLVDPQEPIVDQHVLRAFCHYADVLNVQRRKAVARKVAFKESDQAIIDAYRCWFKSILTRVESSEQTKFKYLLDKVLFIIGKRIE